MSALTGSVPEHSDEYTMETWEDDKAELKTDLLRGIYANGFETPSPIQQQSILPIIKKKDVIAQAQSGTGKTGAFIIGALQLCDVNLDTVQTLILSPTRELAIQTQSVFESIGGPMKARSRLLIGGIPLEEDTRILRSKPPQFAIGCPGRVLDILRRRIFDSRTIHLIILDEADEMLSIGFKEQVYDIFQFLHKDVQVGLFSATIPESVHALTDKFMRSPVKILVKTDMLTLEGISQFHIAFDTDIDKFNALKDLYECISVSQSIIYCNSVRRVTDLYEAMKEDNFPACCIHSGMEKGERTEVYKEFKSGKHRVLVSSDLTSRGLDVQQVSTVINFDVPRCVNTYLHRIGRSGRWGRKGVGISFVTRYDIPKMRSIEAHYHTQIPELPANLQDIFR